MVALRMDSAAPDIPGMIGNVQRFYAQGRFDLLLAETLALMDFLPDAAALHNVEGAAYAGLGRMAEAVMCYDRAIALQPDLADAHGNRGVALKALGRADDALRSYDRAVTLAPHVAAGHYNRANLLRDMRRLAEAVAAYDRAIAIDPQHADACSNRGNALQLLDRLTDALASYDAALRIDPNFAEAHINRGNVLHELRRMEEAQQSYLCAIRLRPDHAEARARALFLAAHMCDWAAFDALGGIAELGITTAAVPPFNLMTLDDDAARNRVRSERWAQASYPARERVRPVAKLSSPRIRIGYFSADFHSHATMYLIAGLLEQHDKSRFEIHAYSYGPDRRDAMRQRAIDAVDAFHDVRHLSDEGVAALARSHGIDIAVDLKGYTQDSRPEIFAFGAAPIQIAWLGYPGTAGVDFIDYIVADAVVTPEAKRRHYSEKLICLPHSYQVNDNRRVIADAVPERAALGLPRDGFVFCCFNNSFKISRDVFQIWMRLLSRVDGSVLWLLRDNDAAVANLRRAAEAQGISGDRLVFAARAPLPEHLARHRCADLFLDSFACNAHTTASDALWAGLPVVTKLGDGFAARVAGSLLHAIGLPELVTETNEYYESVALALALDGARLKAIRANLADKRLTAPLFDTALFARHLEQGFTLACERHARGLVPDHIEVSAS